MQDKYLKKNKNLPICIVAIVFHLIKRHFKIYLIKLVKNKCKRMICSSLT